MPSPKKPKKAKSKKKSKVASVSGLNTEVVETIVLATDAAMDVDDWHEEQEVERSLDMGKGKRKRATNFGSEATNRLEAESGNECVAETPKRQRSVVDPNNEDWELLSVSKKAKKGIHA